MTSASAQRLRRVLARFDIPGALRGIEPHGSGHIHETWVSRFETPAGPARFVHQRLNAEVFPDLETLMANVARVTAHQARALEAGAVADAERRCLHVVRTREGELLARDEAGDAWRTLAFIEGTRSCDEVESPGQAFEAARAFGAFAAVLRDLPAPPLRPTIPHFHDLPKRHADLAAARDADPCGRAGGVAAELAAADRHVADVLARLADAGFDRAPRRVVHNDCKLNNVLFDVETGEALCVIDLDTVMEGTVLADFGDLVRTASCRAPEDETRLERIRVEPALFEALARGYLEGGGAGLSELERGLLPLAGPLMALETGVRFLEDHLRGDRYFRIHRPDQNRDRARAQLRLTECMLAELEAARALVARAGEDVSRPPR